MHNGKRSPLLLVTDTRDRKSCVTHSWYKYWPHVSQNAWSSSLLALTSALPVTRSCIPWVCSRLSHFLISCKFCILISYDQALIFYWNASKDQTWAHSPVWFDWWYWCYPWRPCFELCFCYLFRHRFTARSSFVTSEQEYLIFRLGNLCNLLIATLWHSDST